MRYKQAISVVLLAIVGLGGYYLAGRWSQLSMSLSRSGSNVSPSTSMELYEINLRRMEVDAGDKETGRVLEWKLAVPRAFLLDENGENGIVYKTTNGSETQYSFKLAMQVSEDLKEFTPRTQIKAKGKLPRDILIGSTNASSSLTGSSTGFVVAYDLCVRQSDEKKIAADYGLKKFDVNCYDQDYRCSVSSQIDGWGVSATVTKDLYNLPQETCRITKSFLNLYTVKRDIDPSKLKVTTP